MSDTVLKVAAKAVIVNNEGKVLLLREASSYEEGTNIGRWGVPGGRIGGDEKFYDGLAREVLEETGLTITPGEPLYVGEWWPVIKDVPHHIVALYMTCRVANTSVTLSDEHDAFAWVGEDDSGNYQIMSPDDTAVTRAFALHNR